MPTYANIIKSGAKIYKAPYGEAIPDETSVEYGGAWGGNWAELGFTDAPLKKAYTDERHLVKPEEVLSSIGEWRIGYEETYTTILKEITADQYAMVLDQTVTTVAAGAGQKGYEEIDFNPGGFVQGFAVGFEGFRMVAGVVQPVRWFLYNATFKIDGEEEWSKKTDATVTLPIMIRAHEDIDGSNPPSKWQRITAAATA